MSGLHRALQRADREGIIAWRRGDADDPNRTAVLPGDPPDVGRDAPPEGWVPAEVTPADLTSVERAAVRAPAADPATTDRPETDVAEPGPPEAAPHRRIAEGPLGAALVAATEPGSFAAQQYRFLRTRLAAFD